MNTLFNEKMAPLDFLIGTWNTEGVIPGDDTNPDIVFSGIDSYEWVLNGHFILHKADVMMGAERVEVIELIGDFNEKNNRYKMRSFDNQGTFSEMEAYLDEDGKLHIIGENMRSQLSVLDTNNMAAYWERSEDNQNWIHWMDLKLSK